MATIPQNMKDCEIQILNEDKISYLLFKIPRNSKANWAKAYSNAPTNLPWVKGLNCFTLFVCLFFFGSWWCWICRYHRGQSWKIKGNVLVFGFTYSLYSCTGKFWDRIYEIPLVKLLETNIETSQLLHENFC